MSEDVHLPSPRTAEEPMAFTRDELGRGAWYAWFVFIGLMLIMLLGFAVEWTVGASQASTAFITNLLAVTVIGVIGTVVSLVIMVLGTPLAWLAGHMLRRIPPLGIHLTVYAVFGALIGALTLWLVTFLLSGIDFAWGFGAMFATASAVAVPIGWWLTVRCALREDRSLVQRRPSQTMPESGTA